MGDYLRPILRPPPLWHHPRVRAQGSLLVLDLCLLLVLDSADREECRPRPPQAAQTAIHRGDVRLQAHPAALLLRVPEQLYEGSVQPTNVLWAHPLRRGPGRAAALAVLQGIQGLCPGSLFARAVQLLQEGEGT